MFMAENASSFYLSGAHDTRWNDDELGAMKRLHGSDFEVVTMGTIATQLPLPLERRSPLEACSPSL